MSYLVQTGVCDDGRSYCSDQNEFNPVDAPSGTPDWATLAANLGAVLNGGQPFTEARAQEIAYFMAQQIGAQIAQVDALMNPPPP